MNPSSIVLTIKLCCCICLVLHLISKIRLFILIYVGIISLLVTYFPICTKRITLYSHLGSLRCIPVWKCQMHFPNPNWHLVLWDHGPQLWSDANRLGDKEEQILKSRRLRDWWWRVFCCIRWVSAAGLAQCTHWNAAEWTTMEARLRSWLSSWSPDSESCFLSQWKWSRYAHQCLQVCQVSPLLCWILAVWLCMPTIIASFLCNSMVFKSLNLMTESVN